jgi:hypothetical protein
MQFRSRSSADLKTLDLRQKKGPLSLGNGSLKHKIDKLAISKWILKDQLLSEAKIRTHGAKRYPAD